MKETRNRRHDIERNTQRSEHDDSGVTKDGSEGGGLVLERWTVKSYSCSQNQISTEVKAKFDTGLLI